MKNSKKMTALRISLFVLAALMVFSMVAYAIIQIVNLKESKKLREEQEKLNESAHEGHDHTTQSTDLDLYEIV